jgi:hypothetical protein
VRVTREGRNVSPQEENKFSSSHVKFDPPTNVLPYLLLTRETPRATMHFVARELFVQQPNKVQGIRLTTALSKLKL